MKSHLSSWRQTRHTTLSLSLIIAIALVLLIVQVLAAQDISVEGTGDLSNSSKSVNTASTNPGATLNYTVVISNSGASTANNVVMTDTIPADLTLDPGSISVTGGGNYGISGTNVLTWTGSVNNGVSVEISFSAEITDTVPAGSTITNTAYITGTGSLITVSAATTIITNTNTSFPFITRSFPVPFIPTLNTIPRPNSSNQWTLTWSYSGPTPVTFEVQEDDNPNFTSPASYNPGATQSLQITQPMSTNNIYYYRVRAVNQYYNGDWSNTQSVRGGYRDDFNNANTGWTIRRQDTDTVINSSYYEAGHFVLEIDSGWDYAIGAPMVPAPAPPYAIETSVFLNEPDNLNSYGFIIGGDWNGQTCPNNDYSSCFNNYYRINVIWTGNSDKVKVQIKRIDYHDPDDNAGRGPDIYFNPNITVNNPSQGYQLWRIEVRANGDVSVFVNNNHVTTFNDSTYINNPYFGVFASTDEYIGAEPHYDWLYVQYLP